MTNRQMARINPTTNYKKEVIPLQTELTRKQGKYDALQEFINENWQKGLKIIVVEKLPVEALFMGREMVIIIRDTAASRLELGRRCGRETAKKGGAEALHGSKIKETPPHLE